MLFIGCAKTKGNISDEQLHSLLRETSEAKFLFGKDVQGFITTLYENGVILQSLNSQLESSKGCHELFVRNKAVHNIHNQALSLGWHIKHEAPEPIIRAI
jgi:hypothetical protein